MQGHVHTGYDGKAETDLDKIHGRFDVLHLVLPAQIQTRRRDRVIDDSPDGGLRTHADKRRVEKLFPGHRMLVRKCMIAGTGQHHLSLPDGLDIEIPSVGLNDAEAEFDISRSDQLRNRGRRRLEDPHLDIGMGLAKPPQDRRQIVDRESRQTRDIQPIAALGALLPQLIE